MSGNTAYMTDGTYQSWAQQDYVWERQCADLVTQINQQQALLQANTKVMNQAILVYGATPTPAPVTVTPADTDTAKLADFYMVHNLRTNAISDLNLNANVDPKTYNIWAQQDAVYAKQMDDVLQMM